MTSMRGRLDRLAVLAQPGRCRWFGGRCVKHHVYGDGSDDPPEPDLPAVCGDCGKPIMWRLVCLIGVDASQI